MKSETWYASAIKPGDVVTNISVENAKRQKFSRSLFPKSLQRHLKEIGVGQKNWEGGIREFV